MTEATPPTYQQSTYQTTGYQPTGPVAVRNGMGTAALVLGIIALLTFWTVIGGLLLGLLAVIFGFIGRGRARRGEATNGGAALAGIITGLLGLIGAIAIIAAGATFFEHHKTQFHNLNACVNGANGDQQKINACKRQFQNSINGG